MNYYFDSEVAQKLGVNGAILFQNILYWTKVNRANRRNFIQGRYWTYNSYEAFQQTFPFFSKNTIKYEMQKLERDGYILSDNFSKNRMDHTKWYAVSDKAIVEFPSLGKKNFPSDGQKLSEQEGRKLTAGTKKNQLPTINTNNKLTDSIPHISHPDKAQEEKTAERVAMTETVPDETLSGKEKEKSVYLQKLLQLNHIRFQTKDQPLFAYLLKTYGAEKLEAAILKGKAYLARSLAYIQEILKSQQENELLHGGKYHEQRKQPYRPVQKSAAETAADRRWDEQFKAAWERSLQLNSGNSGFAGAEG